MPSGNVAVPRPFGLPSFHSSGKDVPSESLIFFGYLFQIVNFLNDTKLITPKNKDIIPIKIQSITQSVAPLITPDMKTKEIRIMTVIA